MQLEQQQLLIIFLIIAIIYFFFFYPSQENLEDVNPLDSIEILDGCKDMTVEKLVSFYGDNYENLINAFVLNNIPIDAIRDVTQYPKIASYLVKKGYITEDMCRNVQVTA